MEDHRITCEREGKYVEAEMAKNRVAELRQQDYDRRYQELVFNQTQQREECEQAHIKQYQEFNQQWDEDLLQTQKEDGQALSELENRHAVEIETNRQNLEEKLPLTFKFSAELLNQQKIQESLAKQKKYQEAHQIQIRCQELEAIEREKYMKDRHKRIIAAEAKLIQRQQNEMNALKKKLEANLNERLKLRETEHNKLLQRYQNVKKEIENQQNIERIKFERAFQNHNTRPATATQRSMMASKMGSKMRSSRMGGPGAPASKPSYMK